MKSRITIEVDFDNGNKPVILAKIEQSDDVRDKLIHNFAEMLGGQSSWCNTMFIGERTLRITPIGNHELLEQSNLMRLMAEQHSGEIFNKPPTLLHDPANHSLDELFAELKFGRPKADQDFLDTVIEAFVSDELFDRCFRKKETQKPDFWVIEISEKGDGHFGTYITANLDKTRDVKAAIRFADKESAEAFKQCHTSGGMVIQHAWM